MNTAIAAFIIAIAPTSPVELDHHQAVEQISESCQSGSLIFSKGDCLAVRVYTNSPYTHVALVIYSDAGVPFVYDSMNGVGVRKLNLESYLATQSPDKVHLYHPKRPLHKNEVNELRAHLDAQIGRPYSVKHHITGKRCRGLHCSEYVSEALAEIDWLNVKNPPRVSPASLAEGITAHKIYRPSEVYVLPSVIEPIPEPQGTCARLWQDTKQCTWRACAKLSGWFLCR